MCDRIVVGRSIIQKYVDIICDVICNNFFDKYINTLEERQVKIIHQF
jgi:hypothetical protein